MNKYPHLRFLDIVQNSKLIEIDEDIVVFDATEIAKSLDRVYSNDDGVTYPASYYKRCNPPFVNKPFWVESTTVLSAEDLTEQDIKDYEVTTGLTREELMKVAEQMSGSVVRRASICFATKIENNDSVRWRMASTALHQVDKYNNPFKAEIIIPNATAFLEWDHDGYLITDPANTPVQTGYNDYRMAKLHANMVTNSMPFMLIALSFIHRRTIVERIKPNRTVRKQIGRLTGKKRDIVPPKDFYFIKIKPHPQGTSAISDHDIKPLSIKSRRHKTRDTTPEYDVIGHFRSVGPEGLFGRGYLANEVVWIPNHDRGNPDLGKLHKGYKLEGE